MLFSCQLHFRHLVLGRIFECHEPPSWLVRTDNSNFRVGRDCSECSQRIRYSEYVGISPHLFRVKSEGSDNVSIEERSLLVDRDG